MARIAGRIRGMGARCQVNFVDVGSVGNLPSPWDRHRDRIGRILKFEPRENALHGRDVISVDCALWDREGERDFYIYAGFNGTGSSLFRQNMRFVEENFERLSQFGPPELAHSWVDRSQLVRTERISCRTLDTVLREIEPTTRFDFLKIDAQGAEYQILRGATEFLRSDCQALMLELFRFPLYEGIALAEDVITYLGELGFHVAKTMPPHGTFDSQNDTLFCRDDIRPEVKRTIDVVYGL